MPKASKRVPVPASAAGQFSLSDSSGRHPQIYVYTEPQYAGDSWTRPSGETGTGILKVGYTSKKNVHDRLDSIARASVKGPYGRPSLQLLWHEPAIDVHNQPFMDHSVHRQLESSGVARLEGEWFEAHLSEVKSAHAAVVNKPVTDFPEQTYAPRAEQMVAVERTAAYFEDNSFFDSQSKSWVAPHFLWNAKMRFGKTFTAYKLGQRMGWSRMLVLSFKPAVASSWKADLKSHKDFKEAGWQYVDKATDLATLDDSKPQVWFCSFQQLLHPNASAENKEFLDACRAILWDCTILDEYHFGSWNARSKALFRDKLQESAADLASTSSNAQDEEDAEAEDADTVTQSAQAVSLLKSSKDLHSKHFLYLSGTPFRALATGEFGDEQIFNWTYTDEQKAKAQWAADYPDQPNPYAALPSMSIMAYEMPEALAGVAVDTKKAELSLNTFFATTPQANGDPRFVHEKSIKLWLDYVQNNYTVDANTPKKEKGAGTAPVFPFDKKIDAQACRHTLWLLAGVGPCKAMAQLLRAHPGFKDYRIVVAAGADSGSGAAALDPVRNAMDNPFDTKTITLSCGKLTTGVTVPPWGAIFMLSDLSGMETYFQAAFRVQSPWIMPGTSGVDPEHIFKSRCYVLDFSPRRALTAVRELAQQSAGSTLTHEQPALDELMEVLPTALISLELTPLDSNSLLDKLFTNTLTSQLRFGFKNKNLVQINSATLDQLSPADLQAILRVSGSAGADATPEEILNNPDLQPTASSKKKTTAKSLPSEASQDKASAPDTHEKLREKLRFVLDRLPVYIYLTDDRNISVMDILKKPEWAAVFQTATELDANTFQKCADKGLLELDRLDRLVLSRRRYDAAGLRYLDGGFAAYPFAEFGALKLVISRQNVSALT